MSREASSSRAPWRIPAASSLKSKQIEVLSRPLRGVSRGWARAPSCYSSWWRASGSPEIPMSPNNAGLAATLRPWSTMRIPTRAVRRLFHTLVGGFLCISCGEPERRDAAVRLTQDASTVAPLSGISSIALVNETTACVIDSYEVQIHCSRRSGVSVGVFGRRGEGPGEFRTPFSVVRGPSETLGVIDMDLGRMSVFEPHGEFAFQLKLPGIAFVLASSSFSSTVVGTYLKRGSRGRVYEPWQGEADVSSGATVWERVFSGHTEERGRM